MHVKWTSKARRDLYSVDGYIPGLPFIVPYRISSSTIVILRIYHTSHKWPDQL